MCCGVAVLVVCKHMYDVIRRLSDVLEDLFFFYILFARYDYKGVSDM